MERSCASEPEMVEAILREVIQTLREKRGAILHGVQEELGYVPGDSVPLIADRPIRAVQVGGPLGAYIPRAQVSTLLLPKAARTSFWTRKVPSFVQRDEVMPPIAARDSDSLR